jgi:hypothetical protein
MEVKVGTEAMEVVEMAVGMAVLPQLKMSAILADLPILDLDQLELMSNTLDW